MRCGHFGGGFLEGRVSWGRSPGIAVTFGTARLPGRSFGGKVRLC